LVKVGGHEVKVVGHEAEVVGHEAEVVGNGVEVVGHGVEIVGNGVEIVGNGVEIGGHEAEVGGNGVEVAGNLVKVVGHEAEVVGHGVEIGGHEAEVGGNLVKVGGHEAEIIGNLVKVGGHEAEVVGNGVEVAGNGVEVGGNEAEVDGNLVKVDRADLTKKGRHGMTGDDENEQEEDMALVFKVTVQAVDKPGCYSITWEDKQTRSRETFRQTATDLTEEELTRLWYECPYQMAIGQKLFRFLDGDRHFFEQALSKARKQAADLILQLVTGPETDNWPFELLADDKGFLLLDRLHLVRCLPGWGEAQTIGPENRPLQLLFMACSALDVKPELDFEKEEEAIVQITDKLPVDIEVEDSGSLDGLNEKLLHDRFDVVHLAGHAGIDKADGPFFIMEDETGQEDRVGAGRLWTGALQKNPPRVLFLSGCQTGENPAKCDGDSDGDNDDTTQSFARSLARLEKIPAILGWGRPVGDAQATALETVFYRELSRGQELLKAVQQARAELAGSFLDIYRPAWPLLRVFGGEMTMGALVVAGQKVKPKARQMKHRYLKQGQVRFLEKGFVGRRRQLQAGLKALIKDEDKIGLLLHGLGGLGKSCLAGKLCERFKDHHLVVVHGRLDAVSLEKALKEAFIAAQDEKGKEILAKSKEMTDKLADLCAGVFRERNYLLVLDDFEQNQAGYETGQPGNLLLEAAEPLYTLLHYLPYSGKMTQLIITGRYRFSLSVEGKDLVADRLQAICLTSFKESEQWKKARELAHIFKYIYTDPKLVEQLIGLGRGNPYLMEWIDTLAGELQAAEVEALIAAVQDKQEEFIRRHVLRELVGRGGEDAGVLLRRLGIFRRPVFKEGVEAAALAAGLPDWPGCLDRSLDLGLVEFDQARSLYEVTPMLKAELAAALSAGECLAAHRAGFDYYTRLCGSLEGLDPLLHEEWVFHALGCNEEDVATDKGGDLVSHLRDRLAFRESQRVGEWVLATKKNPLATEHDAFLLNELGYTVKQMGDNRAAIDYYSRALAIDERVYGPDHPEVATHLNNLGLAWSALGDHQKAIDYYSRAQTIDERVYGQEHPKVAIRLNNLGGAWDALGDQQKAIDYYTRALTIDERAYGPEHPDVAIDLNNLGGTWDDLGDQKQAIDYYTRALAIDERVYGQDHPALATDLNNLGGAWSALGDQQKAIDYYTRALAIWEKVHGESHPNVATALNNLGGAWSALGDHKKAIDYYTRALAIDERVYGPEHPNVAIRLNNLGGAYFDLGDKKRARDYFQPAYTILKKFFGDQHPLTQTVKENLDDCP